MLCKIFTPDLKANDGTAESDILRHSRFLVPRQYQERDFMSQKKGEGVDQQDTWLQNNTAPTEQAQPCSDS